MHLLPARRQSGYRCLKLASISCWKLWLQKLTWNCTEWVCSSNWSGSTSAKITFIFAYMSSPLPVYPMINSTWMGSRTKGNKMVSHLLFFRRKKKVKEQKKLSTYFFHHIETGAIVFTWYWPIRLRSNIDLKQNISLKWFSFFSLTNLLDLCRWLCWPEMNFCLNQLWLNCLSPETYQKIWHLPQLNNWSLWQNKKVYVRLSAVLNRHYFKVKNIDQTNLLTFTRLIL